MIAVAPDEEKMPTPEEPVTFIDNGGMMPPVPVEEVIAVAPDVKNRPLLEDAVMVTLRLDGRVGGEVLEVFVAAGGRNPPSLEADTSAVLPGAENSPLLPVEESKDTESFAESVAVPVLAGGNIPEPPVN